MLSLLRALSLSPPLSCCDCKASSMAAATEASSLLTRISSSGPRASGGARKEAADRALSCSRSLCPSSPPLAKSAAPSPRRRRALTVRSVKTTDAGQSAASAAAAADGSLDLVDSCLATPYESMWSSGSVARFDAPRFFYLSRRSWGCPMGSSPPRRRGVRRR